MQYNWQQSDWPNFRYNRLIFQDILYQYAEKIGILNGSLINLPEATQIETMIHFMVAEAVKTSEIEGEYISRKDVMSSIRNQLGLNPSLEQVKDARAQGIAQLLLDIHHTFQQPLSKQMLFNWHRMLLATAENYITIGKWRTHPEPMQIISGQAGKPKVHFEAPPSTIVSTEMKNFIRWFNNTAPKQKNAIKHAPIRAAIAHLYFESIHPFEDGNGRIGRAIAEKALLQGHSNPMLISLSQAIEIKKKDYYNALEEAQKSNEITDWILYFINTILQAQTQAEQQIKFILNKTKFLDAIKNRINQRQAKVIKRMLQEGARGFTGGMNAKKYINITHCSKATATRDLTDLLDKDIFKKLPGSGRSTRYSINAHFT